VSEAPRDPEAVRLVDDREPQPALSIRTTVAVAQLARAQDERLGELWGLM